MTTYTLSSGQTSAGLILNSGDTLNVSGGGIVSSTVINSGGIEHLYPGAFGLGFGIARGSTSGVLYYDADGNGAGAAVKVAILGTHPALVASDILIIA